MWGRSIMYAFTSNKNVKCTYQITAENALIYLIIVIR